jgi:hypothetical protein
MTAQVCHPLPRTTPASPPSFTLPYQPISQGTHTLKAAHSLGTSRNLTLTFTPNFLPSGEVQLCGASMPGAQGAGECGGQRVWLHCHSAQCIPGDKPRPRNQILVGNLARPGAPAGWACRKESWDGDLVSWRNRGHSPRA